MELSANCRNLSSTRTSLVGVIFLEPQKEDPEFAAVAALAAEAGISLLRLDGVYSERSYEFVHLNALGHELVADRLFQVLRGTDGRPRKLGL